MAGIEAHRVAVDGALAALGVDWDAWPEVVLDARLSPEARISAVLVLLATEEADEPDPDAPMAVVTVGGAQDDALDWLGRARRPWQQLARTRLPWNADTATTAVQTVTTRRGYDERRIALALRAARQVCADGQAPRTSWRRSRRASHAWRGKPSVPTSTNCATWHGGC